MKVRLLNLAVDGVLYIAVGAGAIGVWLVSSEVLITAQKLRW
jgi:hypothetical protein